jgi:hypothetical protein
MAQDRGRWRPLVSTAMNLRVAQNAESFLDKLGNCQLTDASLLGVTPCRLIGSHHRSSAKVKNAWMFTFPHRYAFVAWCIIGEENLFFIVDLTALSVSQAKAM